MYLEDFEYYFGRLENFEHFFTSVWECNCALLWAFFGIAFGIEMKTDLLQSCGHCWVFQICWHIELCTFRASSFRIWNSSTGIPSFPLALFMVILPMAHLTWIFAYHKNQSILGRIKDWILRNTEIVKLLHECRMCNICTASGYSEAWKITYIINNDWLYPENYLIHTKRVKKKMILKEKILERWELY